MIDPRQTGGAAGPVSWSPGSPFGSDPSASPAAAWARPPMAVPSSPPSPNQQAAAQQELWRGGASLDSSTTAFNDAMVTLAQGYPLLDSQKTPEVTAWLEAHPDLTYQPGGPIWLSPAEARNQANQAQNLAIDRALLKRPEVRAMLDTLAYTEGHGVALEYNSLYGDHPNGERNVMSDLSTHPGKYRALGRIENVAGRYQIGDDTYTGLSKVLGLTDFSPDTQDLMAVELLRHHGALDQLFDKNSVGDPDFGGSARHVLGTWVSLPERYVNGQWLGHTGANVLSPATIEQHFLKQYRLYRGG